MKIPPGYTEAQVIQAVEQALNSLAPSFTFGCYDEDDIRQQGWVEALDILEKERYDPSRPLANFMFTALKNRLINFRRNKFHRNDPPCLKCHAGTFCCDPGPCKKYAEWKKRNSNKANIQRAMGLEHVPEECERSNTTVDEDVAMNELLRLIDEKLPVDLRSSYLQMRSGVSIPKARRLQVEETIREIIECPNEES